MSWVGFQWDEHDALQSQHKVMAAGGREGEKLKDGLGGEMTSLFKQQWSTAAHPIWQNCTLRDLFHNTTTLLCGFSQTEGAPAPLTVGRLPLALTHKVRKFQGVGCAEESLGPNTTADSLRLHGQECLQEREPALPFVCCDCLGLGEAHDEVGVFQNSCCH